MTHGRARRKPRRYHHGDLRNALVEAAVRLVEEEGVGALSLRAVARSVGVSHMAPYNHFHDRASLVAAVATEAYDTLNRALSSAMARLPDEPARQLQEAGIAYVRFAVTHPALFRLMFSPELGNKGAYPELAEAAARALTVLGTALERSGASSGPDGEEGIAPLLAWSLVHGLAVLLLDGQLGAPATTEGAERYARIATDLLWFGLRSGVDR